MIEKVDSQNRHKEIHFQEKNLSGDLLKPEYVHGTTQKGNLQKFRYKSRKLRGVPLHLRLLR